MKLFKDMTQGYGIDQCPRVSEILPLSFQHVVIAILTALPAPLLISAGLGFNASETTFLVACAMFVTGLAGLIQTLGIGPVGARLPIFLGPSFVFIAPALTIGNRYGYAVYMGACLVASIVCGVVCTIFYKQISKIFQPYISGAVVMTLGASLCSTAIAMCAGGNGAEDYGDPVNFLLAAGTILIVFFLNRFAKGFAQKASPFIAMVSMSVAAAFCGKFDASPIFTEPWLRVPEPFHFGIKFELQPIITITILAIVGIVELLGDQTTAAQFSYDRLPTDKEIRGGIMAQSATSFLGSIFNTVHTISLVQTLA